MIQQSIVMFGLCVNLMEQFMRVCNYILMQPSINLQIKDQAGFAVVMSGFPIGLSFIKGLEGSGNNIVAGTDEGIYYSSNGGDNWYPTNVLNINITSLAASGNYVYAAVPSGAGIYRSVDNGVNWSLSLQSTVDYVDVAAIDNYAFAGSFFGGARYSSDYGGTWST